MLCLVSNFVVTGEIQMFSQLFIYKYTCIQQELLCFVCPQEYLKAVKFNYEDETVQFDRNGDPPGRYDIVNFQVERVN